MIIFGLMVKNFHRRIIVYKEEWKGGTTGKFYDVEYKIPAELISHKTKITVRIEANYGKTAGRVFAVRIIKDEQ